MATHAERYGHPHRRRRRALAPTVAAGLAICARCGKPIAAGEPWDLGHVDGSPTEYAGAEHRRCNRATGRHAKEARMSGTSRTW